jgi:hypothetical protein
MFLAPKRGFPKFGTAAARFRLVFQMVQVSDKSAFFFVIYSETVRGSNPGDGGEISRARSERPWGILSFLYYGWWCFFPPGVKLPGCGFYHPPPSRAEVKQRVELYLYSSGRSWSVLGWTLPLPYFTLLWHCAYNELEYAHVIMHSFFHLSLPLKVIFNSP